MGFTIEPIIFSIFTFISLSSIALSSNTGDPIPATWPEQFHSILLMNNTNTSTLQKVDLWYDWPNGRNFNIIQNQLGELLYDLEWTNGTSFYYTLDSNKKCKVLHFPVGILPPNWLHGATYIGQRYMDSFLCNVWEKVDFITYYEDVVSKRPVCWAFYNGIFHFTWFANIKIFSYHVWNFESLFTAACNILIIVASHYMI